MSRPVGDPTGRVFSTRETDWDANGMAEAPEPARADDRVVLAAGMHSRQSRGWLSGGLPEWEVINEPRTKTYAARVCYARVERLIVYRGDRQDQARVLAVSHLDECRLANETAELRLPLQALKCLVLREERRDCVASHRQPDEVGPQLLKVDRLTVPVLGELPSWAHSSEFPTKRGDTRNSPSRGRSQRPGQASRCRPA